MMGSQFSRIGDLILKILSVLAEAEVASEAVTNNLGGNVLFMWIVDKLFFFKKKICIGTFTEGKK